MSRDPTWAATSVPEIRNRWCNALDATADRQTEIIESPPEGGAAAGVAKRIERLREKATAAIEIMRTEATALRGTELYWVARSIVDAAVGRHSAWRMTMPLPAALQDSHRNGGSVFLIFAADPITVRFVHNLPPGTDCLMREAGKDAHSSL